MAYDWIIRDAQVYLNGELKEIDFAIENGKFVDFGTITGTGVHELSYRDHIIIPGFIDTQVHFREPGLTHKEDLESGSRAAICGGTTSVLEMPNTIPATTDATRLQDKLNLAKERMWCDYGFFIGATAENSSHLGDYENLSGTPGIKIFMGSSTGTLLVSDDEDLLKILSHGKRPCSIHAEDEPRLRKRQSLFFKDLGVSIHNYLRDAEAASLATQRIIECSRATRRPVHVLHISTGDEVELLKNAKNNGVPVTCEVTPQHLYFEAPGAYHDLGTFVQMNPPIREAYHQLSLWKGLSEGVFDVFGSDHAPHTLEEKQLPYLGGHGGSPSGMPGIQTMPLVLLKWFYEGKLSLQQIIQMGCDTPATLFGMKNKGRIKEGFDADFLILKPGQLEVFEEKHVQSKCGWSPFTGQLLAQPPSKVFLRGQVVSENGRPVGNPSGNPIQYDWK